MTDLDKLAALGRPDAPYWHHNYYYAMAYVGVICLRAEVERLKCCGNCGGLSDDGDGEVWWLSCGLYQRRGEDDEPWPDGHMPGFAFNVGGYEPDLSPSGNKVYVCEDEPGEVRAFDPCHFTPSRWTAREEPRHPDPDHTAEAPSGQH
jgi:hypothetical protein